MRDYIFILFVSVCSDSRSQNRASSSSTGIGLPNARCSSFSFSSAFLLPLLGRDCDFRFCGSVSEVAVDEGECDIGGKGTVGVTDSAVSGADVPPTSRGPLRVESGELLDCSMGIATVASAVG